MANIFRGIYFPNRLDKIEFDFPVVCLKSSTSTVNTRMAVGLTCSAKPSESEIVNKSKPPKPRVTRFCYNTSEQDSAIV